MKLAELSKELGISTESFIKFIQDFDLELSECLATNLEVKKDFERFARENDDFLKRYETDLIQKKSVEEIANTINQPSAKVAEIIRKDKPPIYDNGLYRSSVSSFGIDHRLGGNYQFVYDYFGKKTNLTQRDFIGYRDLFFYISSTLEPFVSERSLSDWGIHKAAGIILYGPPGSGKIFWANKIAEITTYRFEEVKKYYYGTSFVDGNKTNFNDFLSQMMKQEKVLLFMEDFDQIMGVRNEQTSVSSFDEETKALILHNISHFEEEHLLMVGSANSLVDIDKEILAPGRFDILIPVFPPNSSERVEMSVYHLTDNLSKDSILLKVLIKNKANHLPFWTAISEKMNCFSNTMVIDFTQSLKKRIRNAYLKNQSDKLLLDETFLKSALKDASAKLTDEYLNQIAQFIKDVSLNNYDDFKIRIETLKTELEHYKIVEIPHQSIGFTHQENLESKKNLK